MDKKADRSNPLSLVIAPNLRQIGYLAIIIEKMHSRLITYLLLAALLIGLVVPVAAQKVIKCAHCGKPITGEYIVYKGKIYHKQCYQKIAPRCAHCGEILKGDCVEAEGKGYHRQCYINYVADRCAVCGKPILGKYIIDNWGNRYHQRHEGKLPACVYCGRIICENITGGGVKYDDGRNVCNLCLEKAVFEEDVDKIIREVTVALKKKGILIDMSDVPVNLVDKSTLNRLSGTSASVREMGFCRCQEVSVIGRKVRQMNTIYVLYGLPRRVFESTLAHEMMHVWMNRNAEKRPKPRLAEGAANYAAYLVLSSSSDKMSQMLIKNMREDSDPIYGNGFRSVDKYIKRKGLASFLQYVRTHDSPLR